MDVQLLSVSQTASATVVVGRHMPPPLLTYPGGQVHNIVLTGRVGDTSQLAGVAQGRKVVHGLTHSLDKHADLGGQSAST